MANVSNAKHAFIGTHDVIAPRDSENLRVYVVTHINEAIENGWVRPYFQPVIRTLTGKLCGFEALARWEDPTYGLLAPDEFITALEEARLIHLLDCEIVRQVCEQYRNNVNSDKPVVPVSFNLSRLDFDLCDIFAIVEQAAYEFEVPRRMLNIEITETVLGTDPAFMAGKMRMFHDAGYQVWMDDFGSGYSTLNALKDFDFDELKIDMEFLNRFGEKSKTILASVVDMAKKLGIQTLAEGVETDEHRDYLRRIGCEKMQGYLYGKPEARNFSGISKFADNIGVETTSERLYLNKVGAINTLSLSERDLTAGNSTQGYVTSMPLAIVEFENDTFTIIDSNRVFREGLANVGIDSIEEAQRRINDTSRSLARHARVLVDTIEARKFARVDYVAGDTGCVMRAKFITAQDGKIALLVSIDDTIEQSKRKRHDRMEDMLSVMYTIYEHVDILHLDEGYSEPVFGTLGLRRHAEIHDFGDLTEQFAKAEVYSRDRERFMAFMNHDSMIERIRQSDDNFITGLFRLREHGGDYAWKMVGLIWLKDQPGNQVMLCIRGTNDSNGGLFQAAFDSHAYENPHSLDQVDLTVTDGSLWRALMRDTSLKLFWKDNDRRFMGANKSFLEYYGFESVRDVLGKTDEDMGWHIDPTPFMDDEMRVLNEGAQIKGVAGQCIVHGEVHDIVATKRPVYRDGHIVGLVGYFFDTSEYSGSNDTSTLTARDSVTGVLNYIGLEAATWKYVDAYKRLGIDFSMISINIESFQSINEGFGYAFGEKVLKRIADELVDIVGNQRVIGHVFAERFVVLSQNDSDEKIQELCDEIERRLTSIAHVDGAPCTIYALAGFSRFSQIGDVEDMKKRNRDNRLKRRGSWSEGTNPGDVITSSLL